MSIMNVVAWIGGVLAVLTLLHFVSDWIFQSHDEAMRKSTESLVRARHCLVYTVIISAVCLFGFRLPLLDVGVYATILFVSHYIEDSYLPVYLWAKYVRKSPEFSSPGHISELDRFKAFASTVLGKILLIAVDQIIHILYLGFIAAMMRVSGTPDFWKLYGITVVSMVVLAVLSYSAKVELRKQEPVQDATARSA